METMPEDFAIMAIKHKETWAELYRKALFEEDRDKLPALLEQAYQAVQERVRELWYSPSGAQCVAENERRELDAAAYYLGLLKSLESRKGFEEGRHFSGSP